MFAYFLASKYQEIMAEEDDEDLSGYYLKFVEPEIPDWQLILQPQAGFEYSFPLNQNLIFTDGSYDPRAPSSGYGIYMGMGHHLNRCVKLGPPHSSGRAEIQAIIQVLLDMLKWEDRPRCEIKIYTDCLFAIKALYHVRSKQKGKKVPPIEDRIKEKFLEFMQSHDQELNVLLLLIQRFEDPVRLSYVKAHSQEHGNERADLYAIIGRIGDVNAAERIKAWNKSTPYNIDRNLASRPHFHFNPCQAARNLSKLLVNLENKGNELLYPNQQVIWDQNHWQDEEEIGRGTYYDLELPPAPPRADESDEKPDKPYHGRVYDPRRVVKSDSIKQPTAPGD